MPNERFARLQVEAEILFTRLNGKDRRLAVEAAECLYEFATSPEATVYTAFISAMDSHALRRAKQSDIPDVEHLATQIIGLAQTKDFVGRRMIDTFRTLESIEEENRAFKSCDAVAASAQYLCDRSESEIDELTRLMALPCTPRPQKYYQ